MSKARPVISRLVLAGTALCLTFVLGVGLIDLFTGHTFLHGAAGSGPRMVMTDEERVAAAARNKGPYATATDPHVGFTMARGATRKVVDADASFDNFGQRVRVGPPPEAGALRIVVLGDSVAFGFGLANDQTTAHYLEEYLAAAMAKGRPRPVVHTIACPGWTQHNACRFLLNHLSRLRPDIVIFVPVGNDLHDGYTVHEGGHRSLEFDAVRGASEVHSSAEQWTMLMLSNYKSASMATLLRVRAAGGVNQSVAHAVMTGLTPESKRRWGAAVDEMRDLDSRLRLNGCRFAVAFSIYDDYLNMFRARVGRALPEIPLIWSCEQLEKLDQLPTDTHPSARYARLFAWCLARSVLKQGWVDGAEAGQLSKLPEDYTGRVMSPVSLEVAEKRAADQIEVWDGFFESEIIHGDMTGFHQIYGAVHATGMVTRGLWLSLKNPGESKSKIRLEMERLTKASGIYPFHLDISVNDTVAGRVEVPAPEKDGELKFSCDFEVPAAHLADRFLDIKIQPSNWVIKKQDDASRLTTFRFLRIGFE